MIPREHGAWAMLVAPFLGATLLARHWSWLIPVSAGAVIATFLAKEPLIVLARQRLVWKQRRTESDIAKRWLAWLGAAIVVSSALLASRWPWADLLALGLCAVAFSTLAVWMTIRNRQRQTWFQIASAIALTSSSLAACISVTGRIQPWCWWFWGLSASQAAAGILVVHSRLEARIAARKTTTTESRFRKPALLAQGALLAGGLAFGILARPWIAAALGISALANLWELHIQKDAASLQTPLTKVGLRALTLSLMYSGLVVAGLW